MGFETNGCCVYPRIQLLSQTAFLSSSSDELEDEERLDWLESWYGKRAEEQQLGGYSIGDSGETTHYSSRQALPHPNCQLTKEKPRQ